MEGFHHFINAIQEQQFLGISNMIFMIQYNNSKLLQITLL